MFVPRSSRNDFTASSSFTPENGDMSQPVKANESFISAAALNMHTISFISPLPKKSSLLSCTDFMP